MARSIRSIDQHNDNDQHNDPNSNADPNLLDPSCLSLTPLSPSPSPSVNLSALQVSHSASTSRLLSGSSSAISLFASSSKAFLDNQFPEIFEKSDQIDSPFTSDGIKYGILNQVITDALRPNSRWVEDNEEAILNDSLKKFYLRHATATSYSSNNNNNDHNNNNKYHSNNIQIVGDDIELDDLNDLPRGSSIYPNENSRFENGRASRHSTTYNELLHASLEGRSQLLTLLQINSDHVSGTHRRRNVLVGNSLGFLAPDNTFRKFCFTLATSRLTSWLMSSIIFIEIGLLSYQMWDPLKTGIVALRKYGWIDYLLIGTNSVYGLIVITRIIAFGLFTTRDLKRLNIKHNLSALTRDFFDVVGKNRDKKDWHSLISIPFLRTIGNIVDLVGLIAFIISTCLGLSGWEYRRNLFLFRSIMCVKVLRITNLTVGTRNIKKAVYRSLPMLTKIGFILATIFCWFSIISVQSYSEHFRKQCVYMNHEKGILKYSNHLCGGYFTLEGEKSSPIISNEYFQVSNFLTNGQYYRSLLNDPSAYTKTDTSPTGYICPEHSYCLYSYNPNYGNMSFDNFWLSLQIMVIILSTGQFSDQMYNLMDTTSLFKAAIFFVPAIIVIGVWLVNVLIACILDTMSIYEDDEDMENSGGKVGSYYIKYYQKNFAPEGLFGCESLTSVFTRFWEFFCCNCILIQLIFTAINLPKHSDSLIINSIVAGFLFIDVFVRMRLTVDYWKFRMNILEAIFAIINVIILIPPITKHEQLYNWLTFFQIIRIYRIMLLIAPIRNSWIHLIGNLKYMINLFIFAALLFYSVSIIYSRFFEGAVPIEQYAGNICKFSSLPNTILSLYVIMTSDNWTGSWYLIYSNVFDDDRRAFVFIYIAAWLFLATLLLVNMFLDLITENLTDIPDGLKKWYQVVNFFMTEIERKGKGDKKFAILDRIRGPGIERASFKPTQISKIVNENDVVKQYLRKYKYKLTMFQWLRVRLLHFLNNKFPENSFVRFFDTFYLDDITIFHSDGVFTREYLDVMGADWFLIFNPQFNSTLFFFGPEATTRKFCQRLVPSFHGQRSIDFQNSNHAIIDWSLYWPTFLFQVVVSGVTIMMIATSCYFTPVYMFEHQYGLGEWNLPTKFDLFYCIFFSIEFIIHIIADGLIFTPTSVLMNRWGLITFVTLISMWIDFGVEINNLENISKYITGVKALRALRLLAALKITRSTFDSTLLTCIQAIFTAGVTSLSMIIPFALWGYHIFAGRLSSCNDDGVDEDGCYGDYINDGVMCSVTPDEFCGWNVLSPRAYDSPDLNFDDFGSAFSSLFKITALDGWADLLDSAMNTTGQMKFTMDSFFVILFNIVSMLIISNLFLSEVINLYSRQMRTAYLTDYQLGWRGCKNVIRATRPMVTYKPYLETSDGPKSFSDKWKIWLHNFFVEPKTYSLLIHWFVFIYLGSTLLYDDITEAGQIHKYIVSIIFSVFILVRFSVIFDFGSQRQGFNLLKRYLSVSAALFSLSLSVYNICRIRDPDIERGWRWNMKFANEEWSLTTEKVLLCFFFAALVDLTPRLNTFVRFSIRASKEFISVLIIWFILFLIYAISLNQIFGLTKFGENTNYNKNVRDIPKALLLLFITSFGEGWSSIMTDFYVNDTCSYDETSRQWSDCGNRTAAQVLFMSWYIISMYLLMNIFVTVIVEAFKVTYHDKHIVASNLDETVKGFRIVWIDFDSEGLGRIDARYLDTLIETFEIKKLFEFDEDSLDGGVRERFKKELAEKGDIENKGIQFYPTLLLLCYYNYFGTEKEVLRTFDDYIWRRYLDKMEERQESLRRSSRIIINQSAFLG